MGSEVAIDLYSTDITKRREAAYSILFERQYKFLDEIRQAAEIEKDEDLAVLMAQVYLSLKTNPRNLSLERKIIELIQKEDVASFSDEMWVYLQKSGSRQMLVSVIDVMGSKLSNLAHNFIEHCMNHSDPIVRAMACEVAIKSGRPTHFAHVLNLVTDKDTFVAETAFRLINDIPADNLAIMVEYALGSSVDWVLENVAPFLPLLINKELRPIMTKVMYHSNELVARKAREALKVLDAKLRSQIKTIGAKTIEKSEENEEFKNKNIKDESVVSLKDKIEAQRKQKELEQKEKEEEENFFKEELGKHTEEDSKEFENELESFSDELSATAGDEKFEQLDKDLKFVDNPDFENELEAFEDIEIEDTFLDDESETTENDFDLSSESEQTVGNEEIQTKTIVEKQPEPESKQDATQEKIDLEEIADEIAADLPIINEKPDIIKDIDQTITEEAVHSETFAKEQPKSEPKQDTAQEKIDLEEIAGEIADDLPIVNDKPDTIKDTVPAIAEEKNIQEIATEPTQSEHDQISSDKIDSGVSGDNVESKIEGNVTIESMDLEAGLENLVVETIELDIDDDVEIDVVETSENEIESNIDSEEQSVNSDTESVQIKEEKQTQINSNVKVAAESNQNDTEEDGIKVSGILSPSAKTIISRYPSFISNPFSELFEPGKPDKHLASLSVAFNQATAFVNLCFLQSCMFFAPPSEVLTKTIKECLRNHLTGSISLRHMHNFAMAMRRSNENPVFFTFTLAKLMTESSDDNPLLMMRELAEYLKSPIEPIEETVPQAIDGFTEILSGLKSILQNKLVMKTPAGAREPFANLSGPIAEVLKEKDRPELELPAGEVILISRDGTAALGLFPYFKYHKRKVIFARPSEDEFKILLERLELEL